MVWLMYINGETTNKGARTRKQWKNESTGMLVINLGGCTYHTLTCMQALHIFLSQLINMFYLYSVYYSDF